MPFAAAASGITGRFIRRHVMPAIALLVAAAPPAVAQGTDNDGPPGRVARLSAIDGTVSLQLSGDTAWSAAPLNYSLTTGDRVFAGLGARAELEIGPFTARVDHETDLTVTNLTDHLAQFAVAQGTLRLSVYQLDLGDTIEIDTPNGAITVRDPGHYRVEVPVNAAYTLLSVDDGAVDVDAPGLGQTVRGRQTVTLSGQSPATLAVSAPAPVTPFDDWSADRDTQFASSGCGQYMSAQIPGCGDLHRYGRWANTPAYGFVWYPPPEFTGWSPYQVGHWVWVEPWGWVWVAGEPWGFAPYHYGRWAMIGSAWGWVPGPRIRPVYSPALVAFVGGGTLGVGVQGWFPLGPRDPYIPSYHYGPGYLRRVNAANVRGVTNINVFVQVTDVSRIRYANRGHGIVAVSTETFRSGHRVDGAVVRVRDDGRGRVQPHPPVMPSGWAVAGGPPANRPPQAGARRPMIRVRPTPPEPPTRRGTEVRPPAGAPPGRGVQPQPRPQPQPEPGRTAQPRSGAERPIMTNRPPPPQNPPFPERAKVMKENPGRPLDPQQLKKLRESTPPKNERPTKGPPRKAEPKKGRGGGGGGGGGGG